MTPGSGSQCIRSRYKPVEQAVSTGLILAVEIAEFCEYSLEGGEGVGVINSATSINLQSVESGCSGTFDIHLDAVADVKNGPWRKFQCFRRVFKNGGRRLRRTNFKGDGHHFEISSELELAEEAAEAFVPIGNHAQFDPLRRQSLKRRQDIVKDVPCVGFGKPVV